MRRLVLVALGVVLCGAVPARAQYPVSPYNQYFNPYSNPPGLNPGGGPRLSPYLNLLRGGNPAANYFMGVVPEIDRRRYQAISQAQIQGLQLSTAVPPVTTSGCTGRLPETLTLHRADCTPPVATINSSSFSHSGFSADILP